MTMHACCAEGAMGYFGMTAQGAAVYLIASLIYFIATRFIGTPFTNSLTDEQREIQKKSARTRMSIFVVAVVIAMVVISAVRPFRCE